MKYVTVIKEVNYECEQMIRRYCRKKKIFPFFNKGRLSVYIIVSYFNLYSYHVYSRHSRCTISRTDRTDCCFPSSPFFLILELSLSVRTVVGLIIACTSSFIARILFLPLYFSTRRISLRRNSRCLILNLGN